MKNLLSQRSSGHWVQSKVDFTTHEEFPHLALQFISGVLLFAPPVPFITHPVRKKPLSRMTRTPNRESPVIHPWGDLYVIVPITSSNSPDCFSHMSNRMTLGTLIRVILDHLQKTIWVIVFFG